MQSSSSPDMRRPREEDSFSLEQVKRGGGLVVSMSSESPPPTAMEVGTPRGNETTIGSCSGLLGATSTRMATDFGDVELRFFGRACAGSFVAARVDEDLCFLFGPTRVVAMVAGLLVLVGDCVMMFAMVSGFLWWWVVGGGGWICRLFFPPFHNTILLIDRHSSRQIDATCKSASSYIEKSREEVESHVSLHTDGCGCSDSA